MRCHYCGKQARWCENKEKYGRNYGKSYMCYLCECGAYVGCHNNTRTPLGSLANEELQQLRHQVHLKIDPYWQTGKISRDELYEKLSKKLGFKRYHTGRTNIEMCKNILKLNLEKLLSTN